MTLPAHYHTINQFETENENAILLFKYSCMINSSTEKYNWRFYLIGDEIFQLYQSTSGKFHLHSIDIPNFVSLIDFYKKHATNQNFQWIFKDESY